MGQSNVRTKVISRDYFRKPYMMNSYQETMKRTPLASTKGYSSTPHSEFEKPYRDNSYSQMQNIAPFEYRNPYRPFNFNFDNDTYVGPENKCNSNLSIGPFDPIVECGGFQIFQPSGKPPFEFFMIQGPGTVDGNVWIAPECPYFSESGAGDLVTVGVIDSCSGIPVVTKGGTTYPSHTSEANFRLVGDDFIVEDECPEEDLIITGEEAPVDNDCYSVSGGTEPYTWSMDVGSISVDGCVTVTGECGPATITVEDSCGNIGSMQVRMPGGSWVLTFSESDDPNCTFQGGPSINDEWLISGVFQYYVAYVCYGGVEDPDCIPSRWTEPWNGVSPLSCDFYPTGGAYWTTRAIYSWQCP